MLLFLNSNGSDFSRGYEHVSSVVHTVVLENFGLDKYWPFQKYGSLSLASPEKTRG